MLDVRACPGRRVLVLANHDLGHREDLRVHGGGSAARATSRHLNVVVDRTDYAPRLSVAEVLKLAVALC